MNKNILYILMLFLTLTSIVYAKEISGTIYGDEGENKKTPLQFAIIQVLGKQTGTYSDKDGKFSLNMPSGSSNLVVSYIGYAKDTIMITEAQNTIEIILKSELKTKDVVVEGEQPAMIMDKSDAMQSVTMTRKSLQKAACCNLSESFQTNPSVDVSYSDALTGAKQIQLLGLQGIYIQMLNEKIPAFRGLASTFGLSYVPGSWMESIQVSKGAASVSTGYESITGQINVEYKKPETAEKLFLNFYGNQYGGMEGNLNYGGNVSDKLSTMLFAHGDIFRTKVDNNHDSFLDKPLVVNFNLFNRWNYMGDGFASKIGIKALYEDRQSGQTGYFENIDSNQYGIDIKTQRYEFFAKNGFIFSDNTSLGTIVSASYHSQNSFYGHNIYDGTQTSAYLNVLYDGVILKDKHTYSAGLSYIYDNYKEKLNDSAMKRTESVPGAFIEYNFRAIDNFSVNAGFRADYHNLYGLFLTPRLHLRYNLTDKITLHASAGKGYHSPSIYSENSGLLSSSRVFITDEKLKSEEAWNEGMNMNYQFELFDIDFTLNAEYYRTDFVNQIIVDMEQDVHAVHFYNLKGKSWSNSFQCDLTFTPLKGMDITAAYRLNDVKMTIENELVTKPLISRVRAFMNIGYSIGKNNWKVDFTVDYHGSGRLPNTSQNPPQYQLPNDFPSYIMFYSQITKTFGKWDLYFGGENLGNYVQPNPILAYEEPFGKYFDSSMIWGPIMGRLIYFGLRYTIY